jgi:hypothetical protein
MLEPPTSPPLSNSTPPLPTPLEAEGGAVPLGSAFYVTRPTDAQFRDAIARGDSIVLVKGARQVGKTSLLARGLQAARQAGAKVVLTDFQTLSTADLESPKSLCLVLGALIAEQLDLDVHPGEVWDAERGANANFERYLSREVLEQIDRPLVWGLDEVDRLFMTRYSDEIFSMFRSWHNKRALEPEGPWGRLTLAISFATEAHLFISDLKQSPFNVGTRITLTDFTEDEVGELNERYGSPVAGGDQLHRFYQLLGGHPFLTRRALHELAIRGLDLDTFETQLERDGNLFSEHLRRMTVLLARDPELATAARMVARGEGCPTAESFYRLRGAGVLTGEEQGSARPRCALYARYLQRTLA